MLSKATKALMALYLLLSLSFFTSCKKEDPEAKPKPETVAELAETNPELSMLADALGKSNLEEDISPYGPVTVFGPTNDAFQELLDSNEAWESINDLPVQTLMNVLSFHVVEGNIMSTDLSDTYLKTYAKGPNQEALSLQVNTADGVVFNGNATPVLVDLEFSYGVLHAIDKVMLPPNIVTLALNNSNFSSLVEALTDSRHTTDFVALLSEEGPFTVFAPTNEAFEALLASNEAWESLSDIPIETLEAVLTYHVLGDANVQADQLSDGDLTMLGGGTLTIDLTEGAQIMTSSGQTVNILVGEATNDVQGTNGVIHAVDAVLIP